MFNEYAYVSNGAPKIIYKGYDGVLKHLKDG